MELKCIIYLLDIRMEGLGRINHYKIFEFEEKMTNRFICNNSHHYYDYSDTGG